MLAVLGGELWQQFRAFCPRSVKFTAAFSSGNDLRLYGAASPTCDDDCTAVACGRNGRYDVPRLAAGLPYAMSALLLQASFDGESVCFLTLCGTERCRAQTGSAARLVDIYGQLRAEHRAGRLGPRIWRVDAALPGGRPGLRFIWVGIRV